MQQEDFNSLFRRLFHALTDKPPLSWQWRLFHDHFVKNDLPGMIDLPTGLGKTMVIPIWLVARSIKDSKLPCRLIYVVDRRTVVDQATDIAEEFSFLLAPEDTKRIQEIAKLKPKLAERKKRFAVTLSNLRQSLGIVDIPLPISTLRGQLADNRDWSKDPSKPAIIIGTVDLIGSGLLFSGYRSSYKRRPLEAGLLAQDSLLVLDEAHLSRPFAKLIRKIEEFQNDHGSPIRVIRMSATSGETADARPPFTLQFDSNGKLAGEDAEDGIITQRFEAKKRLTITEVADVVDAIATEAGNLAAEKPGSRIVIFVKSPKNVEAVRKALIKMDKSRETNIAQLTGTMRGLERDELVTPPTQEDHHERRVMQRFLNPQNDPTQGECFLIATSAGEVGFDLNADHMVCDDTTIDSLIQRLGRVNRRGTGDVQIRLFIEPPKKEKDGKVKKLEGLELAIANTLGLLQHVEDVSPKNIAALKAGGWKDKYADACSPVPTMVELTDILLDNWSMTSITNPMPGRPEVGPWLRGIDDELPQTTIAWRAELDEPGFANLDQDDIEEWFDTHRVLAHETLSVPTNFAARQLLARWASFDATTQTNLGTSRIVVNRAGIEAQSLTEFMKSLESDERQTQKTYDTIRFAELILPASFGGIRRGVGLLDPAEPKLDKDEEKKSPEERNAILKVRQESIDVADIAPGRTRQRIVEATTDGEKQVPRVIGGGTAPKPKTSLRVELESDDEKTVRLISDVARSEKPEWAAQQTLAEHVGLVRQRMDELLNRLDLSETIKVAARLAAKWHDHGKNRERWQRTVNGTATVASTDWLKQLKLEGKGEHQCLGKSGGAMKRDPRGYRHEFGSLRELTDASNADKLTDDVFDLAMHLIATHHGRGRPHFPKGAFDPDCEGQSDQIHTDSIRRFARLQRKYGWWHLAWLENLLRWLDALASADQDAEADSAESEGGTA